MRSTPSAISLSPSRMALGMAFVFTLAGLTARCNAQLLDPSASLSEPKATYAKREVVSKETVGIEIALGRLRLVSTRYKILKRHESFEGDSCQRSIQVSSVEGKPTLRALYSDPNEKWSIQFDSMVGAQWTREYSEKDVPIKIEYSQKPKQLITIRIRKGSDVAKTISQPTLWHFVENNDLEFSTLVLPSLLRLNPCWDIKGTLDTAKLFRDKAGLSGKMSEIGQWTQCVADLEDSDQTVRAAAIEQLRNAGLSAQILLERLSRGELSCHQRHIVDQLLAGLEPRSADTPTRIAYWLSGDPDWR